MAVSRVSLIAGSRPAVFKTKDSPPVRPPVVLPVVVDSHYYSGAALGGGDGGDNCGHYAGRIRLCPREMRSYRTRFRAEALNARETTRQHS